MDRRAAWSDNVPAIRLSDVQYEYEMITSLLSIYVCTMHLTIEPFFANPTPNILVPAANQPITFAPHAELAHCGSPDCSRSDLGDTLTAASSRCVSSCS